MWGIIETGILGANWNGRREYITLYITLYITYDKGIFIVCRVIGC